MKKIILTIVCVVLMLCMFAGCSSGTAEANTEDRIILIDREAHKGGNVSMVDQDGRPLIYDN